MSADENNSKPTDDGTDRPPKPDDDKPVTIDLQAERPKDDAPSDGEDGTPADGAESQSDDASDLPPPVAGARIAEKTAARRGILPLVLAGIVGGIIATILGIAYHASGIVPSRSETLAGQAITRIDALSATVDKRLTAVETTLSTADLPALSQKIDGLETFGAQNKDRIEKLESASTAGGGPAEGGEDIAATLGDIKTRLAKVESDLAAATAAGAETTKLAARVSAVEDSVKQLGTRIDSLAARPDPAAESERAARAVAIGMLQQAVEKGGPFATDLAMIKTLGIDQPEVAELEPLAAKNIPSVTALQAAFPAVADAILVATSDIDPDAGFFEQLGAVGRGLVSVRPTTAIEGDTPEAIVSRMQLAVDSGDLTKALTERNALSEEGLSASDGWASAASDRAKIDGLVDKLALSLTAPGN